MTDHVINLRTEHLVNSAIVFQCKGVRKSMDSGGRLGVMAKLKEEVD